MQLDRIGFHGAYRYATRTALDDAVARARAHLHEEELEDEAFARYFVARGTVLTVNVNVPDIPEQRFAAANVFLILAHGAIDGAVEARRGKATLDVFTSGPED